jgi:hypothetical protein
MVARNPINELASCAPIAPVIAPPSYPKVTPMNAWEIISVVDSEASVVKCRLPLTAPRKAGGSTIRAVIGTRRHTGHGDERPTSNWIDGVAIILKTASMADAIIVGVHPARVAILMIDNWEDAERRSGCRVSTVVCG